MTQENENKQRRVEDKRAAVPLQWSETTPSPAAIDTAANVKPPQREVPEFTSLDTIARVFAEAANGDGKVVLSAQSCDLLYRAMTTPIVAPAVQAQAELTDEEIIEAVSDLYLSDFGGKGTQAYDVAVARAVLAMQAKKVRSAAREQARNEALEEAAKLVTEKGEPGIARAVLALKTEAPAASKEGDTK